VCMEVRKKRADQDSWILLPIVVKLFPQLDNVALRVIVALCFYS
jgi:hypothetical protein